MDPKDLGLGALAGAVCWEAAKQLFSSLMKRRSDANDASRKLVREDIEQLTSLTCEILELTHKYYAEPYDSADALAASREIRGKSKVISTKLDSLNAILKGQNFVPINTIFWVDFKIATTQHLDVARQDPWPDNDRRLTEIYAAVNRFHTELSRIRHSMV